MKSAVDSLVPSRRDFLAKSAQGLFVFFSLSQSVDRASAFQQLPGTPPGASYPADLNAYLKIGADGRVTCLIGKVEYGQGVMTSMAQLLAEELDVALDSVDVIAGDTSVCPWDMGTFGSLSTRQFGPALRAAGANARAVLLGMAAERLAVPASQLEAKAGIVFASGSPDRRVTYAQLVQGKRIDRVIEHSPLKRASVFTVIGTSPLRKDALDKVTGRAKYAGDIALPGMLYARILRPPAHGASLKSADTSAAEKLEGVRVVRDGETIAVLHERPDLADRARDLIHSSFDRVRTGVDDVTIFDHLLKAAPPPQMVDETGNLAEGERLASSIAEETWLNSYVAHATLETHSALASVAGGKATVWASTQTPFPLQQQIAQALGCPVENVRVIAPYVGGGFGGKSASGQAILAARLSRITGRPVQVVLNRAEEFFEDTFRPAAVVKIRAGLTAAGRISFWDYKVFCAGDREAKTFYDIPHQRTMSAGGWQGGNPPGLHPFGVGPWRGPSVNTNTFARESHIDILAGKARVDPLEFRLNHLSDKRMRRVLEAAAQHFSWKPKPGISGEGVGLACAIYSGTYVATIARVTVDRKSGQVHVRHVVSALDAGLIVNPDGARQQMEGAVAMGLGYALSEEVRFRDGEILDRNFDTYEIPRFSWMPKIETILTGNPETPPSGCGEPPVTTMGAVIANAIYDATGVRMLQLPMTPARVLAALRTVALRTG